MDNQPHDPLAGVEQQPAQPLADPGPVNPQAFAAPNPDTRIKPEELLQKFLNGEAIAAHDPLTLVVGPMNIENNNKGGFIVNPPSQLLVDYKK